MFEVNKVPRNNSNVIEVVEQNKGMYPALHNKQTKRQALAQIKQELIDYQEVIKEQELELQRNREKDYIDSMQLLQRMNEENAHLDYLAEFLPPDIMTVKYQELNQRRGLELARMKAEYEQIETVELIDYN